MKTSLWSLSQHRCLLSLLLLLQLSSSSAGQFRVIGPGHPIRALVGDEAELPCRISPGKNATGMEVGWYRPPFSRVVHLYRNGKDQDAEQAPEYRGRTELLKETIAEGKVTLRIRNVRFSDEGGFTCFFRDHSYQEEAAMELKVEDPFYWINPGVLVLIALLPTLFLQVSVGLVFLFLQHRLRGKLRAEVENLHRTFDRTATGQQQQQKDPHFLRVPCWKITLFVIVPVLGPLVALIICYNWLHRRLAGQFLEELKNTPWLRPDSLSEDTHVPVKYRNDCTEQDIQNFYITNYRTSTLQIVTASSKKKQVKTVKNSNVESRGLGTEKSPQCQGKLSEPEYEYKNLSQNLEMESKEN